MLTSTVPISHSQTAAPITLPRGGVAAEQVVSALAVDVIDGLHSAASGRFFAWVIGGALSAAFDADWLTAARD
jgi:hypothetical protein